MRKRIQVSYTINKNVVEEFDSLAKENCINKSGLVEKLILEYIKKNEKKFINKKTN